MDKRLDTERTGTTRLIAKLRETALPERPTDEDIKALPKTRARYYVLAGLEVADGDKLTRALPYRNGERWAPFTARQSTSGTWWAVYDDEREPEPFERFAALYDCRFL